MATSLGNLVVKLSTDNSQLKRGIGQSIVEMNKFRDSIGSSMRSLKGLAAGYLSLRGIGELVDLGRAGAQASREEARFRAFAGGVQQASDMLAAFNRGAGFAADKMTAMQTGGKLLQMGLVDNAAAMERVVEMATRLGKQTDSVEQRVSDFAATLANQSMPRLDNFGISSGRVRQSIEAQMKATKGLTREQAFMNAVMEAGSDALALMGERADDDAMKMEKLESKYKDLKTVLGQGIAPVMGVIAGHAASWMDSSIDNNKAMSQTGKVFAGIVSMADRAITAISAGVDLLVGGVGGALSLVALGFADMVRDLFNAIGDGLRMIDKATAALANTSIGRRAGITGTNLGGIFDSSSVIQGMRESQEGSVAAISEAVDQFGAMITGAIDSWDESTKRINEYNAAVESLNKDLIQQTGPGGMVAQQQSRWSRLMDQLEDWTRRSAAMDAATAHDSSGMRAFMEDIARGDLIAGLERQIVSHGGFTGGDIAPAEFGSVEFARATSSGTTARDRIAERELRETEKSNDLLEQIIGLLRQDVNPNDPVNFQALTMGTL